MEKILVGVCTYRRPQMLEACLDSLAAQIVPPGLQVEIIVIDNDGEPAARDLVRAFRDRAPFPVNYKHEPRRGIAVARNAVLIHAEGRGCFDWISFIDDDEIAEPTWLANLMHEDYRGVSVLEGRVERIFPEPLPFWACQRERRRHEGRLVDSAATGNVRFSAALIKAGLRFNEALGLLGGEDGKFFADAHRAGFEISRTERAIVREIAHRERLTYFGQCYRAYWASASHVANYGRWRSLDRLPRIPVDLLLGVLLWCTALICAPVSLRAFKYHALHGGRKIAKAAGRLMAFAGILPQPYRVTVGN